MPYDFKALVIWGFMISIDNPNAVLGIPCLPEPIRDNNSAGVTSQKSLSLIAPLTALG